MLGTPDSRKPTHSATAPPPTGLPHLQTQLFHVPPTLGGLSGLFLPSTGRSCTDRGWKQVFVEGTVDFRYACFVYVHTWMPVIASCCSRMWLFFPPP